ncbi:beta strand repeat-containing protein [Thiomicrorhabdus hydrogeniphila]
MSEDSATDTASGNALSNDSAFDAPVGFSGWDASNSAQYGTFTANANGTYSYTLDNTNATVNALNDNSAPLTETFNYTIHDADGDESTASVTITINGHTDGTPTVDVNDENGLAVGDNSIAEDATGAVTGTFTITAEAGVQSINVAGTTISEAQLGDLTNNPVSITNSTDENGTLTITSYDAATGVIGYSYAVDGDAKTHNATDDNVIDNFAITVTDDNGTSSTADSLDILITDTAPVANNESHTLSEDSATDTASGNALSNDSAFDAPVGFSGWDASNSAQYGTFTANANGTYSYTLDNTNATVNALNDNSAPLTETFNYTIHDADGDESTASVTITINGHTDGTPTVDVNDENGLAVGDNSIAEDATGAVTGTFTITAEAGVQSINVAGTTISEAQLGDLTNNPVSITNSTDENGTLTITSYDAATGVIGYSYAVDGDAKTHNATDDNVIDNFAITVTDDNGTSSTADSLDILITDTAPVANNESHTLSEDSATDTASGNALSNDSAFDAPVGFSGWDASNSAQYGTFTANANGTYSYTLDNTNATVNALNDNSAPLTETFNYTIHDADGDESTASVTITINGHTDGTPTVDVNDENGLAVGDNSIAEDATGAVTGTFTITAEAGVQSINVAGTTISEAQLGDLTNNPVSITNSTDENGTLTITSYDAATGVIGYSYAVDGDAKTHNATDDNVIDNFAITVTDDNGTSSTADSLDILITDTAPVANNESHTLSEDSATDTASGNALSNDSAFDAPVGFSGWDASNSAQYGTFTANANGTYSYTLDNTNATVNALNDNSAPLTETFNYTIHDADGDESTASVTITINGHTDGTPTVDVNDENGLAVGDNSIAEDATGAVTGTFTITAEAGVQSINVAGTTISEAQLGDLTNNPVSITNSTDENGTLTITSYDAATGVIGYSYAVDGDAKTHNATDDNVIDNFAITVTDDNGTSSTADSLDILITDTAPVANNESHTLSEDSATDTASGNALSNDSAFDAPVGFSGWDASNSAQYGTFTANANGTYSYTLDNTNATVNALNDNSAPLTETFNYTIHDADGDESTASVTITINGHTDGTPTVDVNDENGLAVGDNSIAEDATGAVTGTFTITAEAGVQSINVAGTTISEAQLGDLTNNPVSITNSTDENGTLTITSYDAATGVIGYSYAVDGDAKTHNATDDNVIDNFAITVTDDNGTSSTADSLDILITDTAPVANNESHTLSEDSATDTASGNALSNDSAFDAPVGFSGWDASNSAQYGTFTANANGTYSYTLDNTNATVNALNDNSAPLTETFNYTIHDADGDESTASVTITINGHTDGTPTVDVNDENGLAVGDNSIAEDATGAVTGTFTITAEAGVQSINVAGTTISEAQLGDLTNNPVSITNSTDENGTLTITSYDAATGVIGYSYAVDGDAKTHNATDDNVIDNFAITVTDDNGTSSTADSLDILITDTAPVANNESHTLSEDSATDTASGNALSNDSAFDAPVGFSGWDASNSAQYGTFTANANGTYSYTLDNTNATVNALNDNSAPLTETFNYTIHDADGDESTASVTITINGHTDGTPTVDVNDENGLAVGDNSIAEDATGAVTGTFTITAEAGVQSINVAGTTISEAQLGDLTNNPVSITNSTDENGTLTITSYDAATGVIGYSYAVDGDAKTHNATDDNVIDNFAITVTDDNGTSSTADSLDILITDTAPVANNESHTLSEDSATDTASGNALSNDSAFDAPVGFSGWDASNSAQYGTFTANANGTYSYTLDNTNATVNALNDNSAPLTETFNYTIHDADGDESTASVTITINGHTDGTPTVDVNDENGLAVGDNSIAEDATGAVTGTFTITAEAGVQSINVAGTTISEAQLGDLTNNPVSITNSTDENGTLTITSYDAATGVIGYSYAVDGDAKTHNATDDNVIDNFAITVTDDNGTSSTADSLDILITDTAPVANNESHTLSEDSATDTASGNALSNDSAFDAPVGFSGWDASNSAQYGTFTANANGTYSYTLDNTNATVNALNDNSAPLTETFNYTIHDADGDESTASVTITINGHTDGTPTVDVNDENGLAVGDNSIAEDATGAVTGTFTITAEAGVQSINVAGTTISEAQLGDLTNNPVSITNSTDENGTLTITSYDAATGVIGYSYAVDGDAKTHNATDDNVIDNFAITVTDDNGTSSTADSLDILITDTAPVANNESHTLSEDSATDTASGNALSNDSAFDAPVGFSGWDASNSAQYGTFTANANGTYSYTLDNTNATVNALNDNSAPLTETFNYTIHDADGDESTASVTITINGHTDGTPTVDVNDENGLAVGDNSIAEDATGAVTGTFTITAEAGVQSINVAGTTISEAQLGDLTNNPVSITNSTDENGTLTITSYDAATGVIGYSYAVDGDAKTHNATDDNVIDNFAITVTDDNGTSSTADSLDILITDTAPVANNESHTLSEDSATDTASGNALSNDSAFDAPVGFSGWDASNSAQYGTFTANANGTYSYTLDNTNATVNALNDNSAPLTETFNYTIHDADGDESTASVTITINGHTDGTPTVDVNDENGLAVGDNSIAEDATGAVTGTFTITAEAGVQSINVAGTTISEAQLGDLTNNPVSITNSTDENGTLTITSYDAATGVIGYSYAVDGDAKTHNATDDNVIDNFAITVTDDNGTSSTADSLDILITDTAPVANNESHTLSEDSATDTASGNALSNDSAFDAPVGFSGWDASNSAQYGTFTANANGTYSYTLDNTNATVNALNDNSAPLTETFNYTIHDADGDESTASVTITINGHTDGTPTVDVNDENGLAVGDNSIAEDATGAVTGTFTITAEAGVQSINVAGTTISEAQLGDLTNNPVSITNSTDENGTLTITSYDAATGVIGYSYAVDGDAKTHNATDDNVIDNFAITVTDDNGTSSTADSLDILITDTAPVANNESHTLSEDSATDTASGNALSNDSAFDAPVGFSGWDASNSAQYGTFTANANGTYSYTLDNTNATVNALNDNSAPLTETFNYTIHDADGDESTASVTITINGHTDGTPTVDVNDENGLAVGDNSIAEDATGAVTGTFTITAEAGVQSINVAGTTISEAQLGDLTNNPVSITNSTDENGTLTITSYDAATGVIGYSYAVDGDAKTHNATDDNVIDNFAITVTDDNGTSSTADSLDILITDTAPVANNESHTLSEDSATDTASGNALSNDSAFDAPVGFSGWDASNSAQYGTFTANANGTYSYTLDNTNATVNALNDNSAPLTETFNYTIHDADGDESTASVTITINGHTDGTPTVDVNDENGLAVGDNSIAEDATGAVTGTFTITAEAGVQSINVAGTTISEAQLGDLTNNPVSITNSTDENGTLTITSYDAATGVIGYSYAVDGDAKTHNATDDNVIDNFAITVTDDNGTSSTADSLDILITDTAPVANNESHTLSEDSATDTASGNALSNDSAFDAPVGFSGWDASNSAQYGTFTANANGTYSYTLDNTNATVNALNDNSAPLTETFNYTIHDADGDESTASVTITINGHTDGTPTVDVNDENGLAVGDNSIAEDATGAVTGTFTITAEAGVQSINVAGTTISEAQLGDLTNNPVSITNSTDENGTLTITSYDAATGVIGYSYAVDGDAKTHNATDDNVIDNFAITVTDDNGTSSTADSLDILITDTAPVANNDANSITEDSVSVSGNVITTGTGADTLGLDATVVSTTTAQTGSYGTVTINANGSYTYVLDNNNPAVQGLDTGESVTDTFSYTLTDADGDTSTADLVITVNGTNDGPVCGHGDARVSEELLAGGIEDTIGSSDLGAGKVYTGSLSVSDADTNDSLTVTLTEPTTTIKSNDVAVEWSGDGTASNPLIGTAGSNEIIRAVIDDNGNYTVTLSGPVDHSYGDNIEGELSFDLGVNVSDGTTSANNTLTVVVEDDSPDVESSTNTMNVNLDVIEIRNYAAGWNDPVSTANSSSGITQINNDSDSLIDELQWGSGSNGASGYDLVDDATLSSSVSTIVNPGEPIVLGTFTHNNFPVTGDTLETVTLTMNMDVLINGVTYPVSFDIPIVHDETTNSDDALASRDIITLPSTQQTVTVQGQDYVISIDGFINDDGDTVEVIYTNEDEANSFEIVGSVQSVDSLPTVTGSVSAEAGADGSDTGVVWDTTTSQYGTFTGSSDGSYTFTLNRETRDSLEDGQTLQATFDYTVTDNDGDSTTSTLTVDINGNAVYEDLQPESIDEVRGMDFDSQSLTQDTNVILTIDTSGSMTNSSGEITLDDGTTTTRLALAKQALTDLINSYNTLGTVNVKLVDFAESANVITGNSGNVWMSAQEALTAIENLDSGGNTNYEDAILKTYEDYTEPAADQTVAYFISDGTPNRENNDGGSAGSAGTYLDEDYITNWTSFLANNVDDLHVVALGEGISNYDYLDVLATAGGVETTIVTDATQLSDALAPEITVSGDALDNIGSGTTLDNISGGNGTISIDHITVNGTDYNANDFPSTGVDIAGQGNFTFDFTTGQYSYSGKASEFASDTMKTFSVTAVDQDGDPTSFDVRVFVNVDSSQDRQVTQTDDFDTGNDGWSTASIGSTNTSSASTSSGELVAQSETYLEKEFTGLPAGQDVSISFDARSFQNNGNDSWESSDRMYVYINGVQDTSATQSGSFDEKLTLTGTTDSSGNLTVKIAVDSSYSGENLAIDNFDVSYTTPGTQEEGLILYGDDNEIENFVINPQEDTKLVDFDTTNDVLDLSEVIDSSETVTQGTLENYLNFAFLDSSGNETTDQASAVSTKITVDSNGEDTAGGDTTAVVLQDRVVTEDDINDLNIDYQNQ